MCSSMCCGLWVQLEHSWLLNNIHSTITHEVLYVFDYKEFVGLPEVVQWHRVVVTLEAELLFPNPPIEAHICHWLQSYGTRHFLLAFRGIRHACGVHTYMQANTDTHKANKSFLKRICHTGWQWNILSEFLLSSKHTVNFIFPLCPSPPILPQHLQLLEKYNSPHDNKNATSFLIQI